MEEVTEEPVRAGIVIKSDDEDDVKRDLRPPSIGQSVKEPPHHVLLCWRPHEQGAVSKPSTGRHELLVRAHFVESKV